MSKKLKALQVSALLSAVTGATLIMSASAPVQAAEESCWSQLSRPNTHQYVRGCAFDQYGLKPGLRPADGGADKGQNIPDVGGGGGGGPRQEPGYPQ
ncbi:MAG: hypothetical protein U1E16_03065 [Hyphomicrobiales bacterium]